MQVTSIVRTCYSLYSFLAQEAREHVYRARDHLASVQSAASVNHHHLQAELSNRLVIKPPFTPQNLTLSSLQVEAYDGILEALGPLHAAIATSRPASRIGTPMTQVSHLHLHRLPCNCHPLPSSELSTSLSTAPAPSAWIQARF